MENTSLLELLTDQLRDVYDAEKQLTKALPRMAKAASDEELAEGFREHTSQTQEQARRLEQAFESLGMKARSKPCPAMKGLIDEGREVMEEEMEDSMTDLAVCAAARRVEHYEIAAYDAMFAMAKAAKLNDVAELLGETLREESDMDKRLANISKRLLKDATSRSRMSAGAEEEGSQSKGRSASSSRGKSSGRSSGTGTSSRSNGSSASRGGQSRSKSQEGGRSQHLSNTTTDPDEIRRWAEDRGGRPACVQGTGGKGDIGVLRIEFPGKPNANDSKLTPISWEDFFDKFEERGLALVYQDHTANGQKSNFNKIIAREEGKPKARAAR